MATDGVTEGDWQLRLAIYAYVVAHAGPPTPAQMARQLGASEAEAREGFQRLNAAHAIFLEPGSDVIRMASPLSGVATPYSVSVDGHMLPLFANCAWDSLGIPAMLRADARVHAHDTLSGDLLHYAIADGQLVADTGLLVHFAVPFKHWYDDLILT
jgi:hypothetical protein